MKSVIIMMEEQNEGNNLFQWEKEFLYLHDELFSLITICNNCELLNRFLLTDESSDKSDLGARNRIGDNKRPQITQRLGDNGNYMVGWI